LHPLASWQLVAKTQRCCANCLSPRQEQVKLLPQQQLQWEMPLKCLQNSSEAWTLQLRRTAVWWVQLYGAGRPGSVKMACT
jgi:hypothetical protein